MLRSHRSGSFRRATGPMASPNGSSYASCRRTAIGYRSSLPGKRAFARERTGRAAIIKRNTVKTMNPNGPFREHTHLGCTKHLWVNRCGSPNLTESRTIPLWMHLTATLLIGSSPQPGRRCDNCFLHTLSIHCYGRQLRRECCLRSLIYTVEQPIAARRASPNSDMPAQMSDITYVSERNWNVDAHSTLYKGAVLGGVSTF
jgi:hypothetical protein